MDQIFLMVSILGLGAGLLACTAIVLKVSIENRRIIRAGDEQLKQHLMSLDLHFRTSERYNRMAETRLQKHLEQSDKWLREIGYKTHQIFERVDEPEDGDQDDHSS